MTDPGGSTGTRPGEQPDTPAALKTVPVRHPGRWVASAVILVLLAMLVNTLFFSSVVRGGVVEGRFQWPVVGKYLFARPVLRGIGVTLEREIEQRTGYESRVTILGHVQRGGTPVAYDRVLATRFGVAAMDAVAAEHFGSMVALSGTQIVEVALEDALREPKLLDPALYETAQLFFG